MGGKSHFLYQNNYKCEEVFTNTYTYKHPIVRQHVMVQRDTVDHDPPFFIIKSGYDWMPVCYSLTYRQVEMSCEPLGHLVAQLVGMHVKTSGGRGTTPHSLHLQPMFPY